MNLLILGGYSDYNRNWVENIQKNLGPLFESSEILYYKHWSPYNDNADIKPEVENLAKIAEGKKDIVVFAKSAGVSLTLQAIRNGYVNPVKCIFAGMAYEWSKHQGWDMDNLLEHFQIPTLFLQQSQDLSTPFQTIKETLEKLEVINYDLIELPGGDHQYSDMEEIKHSVESFLKQ
jgi:pimeloyl-ACP methyl ester carboxylesterase